MGLNSNSLELIALLALVFAVIFGFRRIEQTLLVTALNQCELHANEARGGIVAKMQDRRHVVNEATGQIFNQDQAAKRVIELTEIIKHTWPALETAKSAAYKRYRRRNGFALSGSLLLLVARAWSAYV